MLFVRSLDKKMQLLPAVASCSMMHDDNNDFAARVNLGILDFGACNTETVDFVVALT
jgi:hypothetical protein